MLCQETLAVDLTLLKLRIKDIVFKNAGQKQYAEVLLQARQVPGIYH